ncbi:histidine kinase [Streptomyces sp. WM6373]|uniref:HAMP domain-containing sensor histidine kinase n=1 Tax=Streptomyces TaxID=1883 RepID=UPI0006AF6C42|nr:MULTISPECIES: HAMP domain-containing sensor histidine kinase [unclassified Streptomyces]KOU42482.1 histidine kinase [Streptomyces sp. WM6373]KOU61170.1 histidine kinase [Streptomyces sp. IGB124]KOU78575.1 histidine kinase [Streptomyces sp. XY66]KOV21959.1 histidine kinase [Streptomyces sp. XY413]
MRRSLAGVALAVTSMVALSFLIPLALLVMSLVKEQGVNAAEQRAAALAPVLTLTTDPYALRESAASLDAAEHLVVHLPGSGALGTSKAPAALLERAQQGRESISQEIPNGWICLQPVVLPGDQVAVIENFVPEAELTRGVKESWAVMLFLAVGLVGGSVLVADRLGAKVVRSSKRLAQASQALGQGDLDTRVDPMGPPELRDAGIAFNAMAHRMTELLAVERELVADLSHRLRTPLTALHLASERMAGTPESARVEAAVGELETELQAIIAAARTPLAVGPMGQGLLGTEPAAGRASAGTGASGPRCEAADVVRRRTAFWSVLAEQQNRCCTLDLTQEPTAVSLSDDDIAAVVDALIGNIFRHTAPGTPFGVQVVRTAQAVELVVEDGGPGIPEPDRALSRGSSTGSTGLGLDIAQRAATATGGSMRITRGPLGGAHITVTFSLAASAPSGRRLRRPRTSSRRRPAWARGR